MTGPLHAVVEALTATGTAAQVFDAAGRLHWASGEMLAMMDVGPDDDIGIGRTLAEGTAMPVWRRSLEAGSLDALAAELAPRVGPGAGDGPPVWVAPLVVRRPGSRLDIGVFGIELRGGDGTRCGTALVYAPKLPARVLALLVEGDAGLHARLADLAEPRRRAAAVLFADIDASGPLARSMPTELYFELIRDVTTTADDLVVARGGITGTHAGDGAVAFFVAGHHDSEAAAARAAVTTALDLAERVAATGHDVRLNVGAHWGPNLYIGQITSGGRLEVTALGDEVNECARIEQVARGGRTLVSKVLVERLDDGDARDLGLDRRALRYTTLAELGTATEKATRDAGTLAVADLTRARPRAAVPSSAPATTGRAR
ncbi:adenylate/guanylate cyclase domain-containing protein [Pseudonocardia spirodelae]|uniref:Adenylate/guanylate cyclase domain-containing protein n=1 Tax=Pseudonocardia spirodelae TaxID=3133431 RepID=A0ABU8T1G4_9PSEU